MNIPIHVATDWQESFRRLKTNWDSYGGSPPTEVAIDVVERIIGTGRIAIVPSNSGGIYIELYTDETSYLLHIGPDGEQKDD